MKKLLKILSLWWVQLLVIALILGLGLTGFFLYYFQTVRLGWAEAISNTVYSTIRLFAFSFDLKLDNGPHPAVVVMLEIARWLAVCFTGHLVFRLIRAYSSRFRVKLRTWRWKRQKDQILLVGVDEGTQAVYRSIRDPKGCAMLADSPEDCDKLAQKGFNAVTAAIDSPRKTADVSLAETEKLVLDTLKTAVADPSRTLTVVINREREEENLHICKACTACLRELTGRMGPAEDQPEEAADAEARAVGILERIHLYVFGSRQYHAIYRDLQDSSLGVLKYSNKYQLAACDFILRYPMIESFDRALFEQHVKNACLSPELSMNLVLIGFGETNQEIFTASFATDQYLETRPGGIPQPKQIHYHVFDRSSRYENKNLNQTVFRYRNDFLEAIRAGILDARDYYPYPDFPADFHYHPVNLDDSVFFRELRQICTPQPAVTQIVVAVGSDLENMDVAQRLMQKKQEWGLQNVRIFAKVRRRTAEELQTLLADSGVEFFGNEEETIFDYRYIRHDTVDILGRARELMYAEEQNVFCDSPRSSRDVKTHSTYRWFAEMGTDMRQSNTYSILSLRMKLLLLGLDFRLPTETTERPAGRVLRSNREYFERYAGDRLPALRPGPRKDTKKESYLYDQLVRPEDFCLDNPRFNLAVQEHARWNAYMIRCGFVPETKENAKRGSVKDYLTRRHANLSTFEGLFEFRRETAQAKGCGEIRTDTVKYDFQLMDDAWWLLHMKGWEIFERYPRRDSAPKGSD